MTVKIKIGDKISTVSPKTNKTTVARVTRILLRKEQRGKNDGEYVNEVPQDKWHLCIFDTNDGHWAYGDTAKKID